MITAALGRKTARLSRLPTDPTINAYLANDLMLMRSSKQEMAAHESPRTAKPYDRTKELLIQDEVERIIL